MNLETPIINYNYIKINNTNVELSSRCKASFTAPYNKIDVSITPTNCSLSYYEVRVTTIDEDYDIGVGNLGYWDANIAANAEKKFSIPITSTIFTAGDKTYRLSFYGKSSIDGSWDATYLFFTIDDEAFEDKTLADFEVLTDRLPPENT